MKLSTNTAAVLVVGLVALVAVAYLAPPDLVREAFYAVGSALAMVLAVMRPLLSHDQNRNGIPGIVESALPDPEEEE